MKIKLITLAAAIFAVTSFTNSAKAALVLSIDQFDASTFTISISGTLDTTTSAASFPGVFTVTPSELVDIPFYSGTPLLTSGFITINALLADVHMFNNGGDTGFSLYFFTNSAAPVPAGTAIAGSVSFSGTFFPNLAPAGSFGLWSGYDSPRNVARLETTAVPEPSSAALFGLSALALSVFRRRLR